METFCHFVICSQGVKALRQRSWGPHPTSLLFGVAERNISKGVKAKLTSQTTPASMVWYVLHTCGRAEAVTCAVSGARAIARTNAQSRWHESKERKRKIPVPAPSRHAPRKRGAWRVSLLGLDLLPGPLEPSLSRDRSRTSERFEILAGQSRIGWSVHMETRAITFYHFLLILTRIVTVNLLRVTCFSFFMGLVRNRYCKPVARDLFFMFYGSWQELISTANLSRATCFVIVLVPAIVERHVLIPAD